MKPELSLPQALDHTVNSVGLDCCRSLQLSCSTPYVSATNVPVQIKEK